MKKLLLSAAAICAAFAPVCSQSLNLNLDNAHAPFVYGVASADPSENSVLIWTAVAPDVSLHNATITWQISADSLFASVLNNGTLTIDSGKGYTVKTDVTGLSQGITYYYRFEHAGNYSTVGITYTAFSSSLDSMNFGLVSCSSLFSGYFNAYRQMAAMPGMRALVHVGDVIYDGVDPEEAVRVPEGAEEDLRDSIQEDWRARHRLYLSDPDFREARRKFPWIVTWDNHDVLRRNPAIGAKAFREFVPFREDETDSTKVYRKVSMGPLVDFFMIDINTEGGIDSFGVGNLKAMSDEQFEWLLDGLQNSTAKWKCIGSQKLMAQWDLLGAPLPGSGLSKTWNGYPQSRELLLSHLQDNNIDNVVVLSGDFHMNIWSDLSLDPFDSSVYDTITGEGSIAIEMMGTSLTRGNLDESGLPYSFRTTLETNSMNANPQQHYLNLFDHGFNTVTLFDDSLVGRSFVCPILTLSDSMVLDAMRVCRAGDNRWQRVQQYTSIAEYDPEFEFSVFPNPSSGKNLNILLPENESNIRVELRDAKGRLWMVKNFANGGQHVLNAPATAAGMYFLNVTLSGGNWASKTVVFQ